MRTGSATIAPVPIKPFRMEPRHPFWGGVPPHRVMSPRNHRSGLSIRAVQHWGPVRLIKSRSFRMAHLLVRSVLTPPVTDFSRKLGSFNWTDWSAHRRQCRFDFRVPHLARTDNARQRSDFLAAHVGSSRRRCFTKVPLRNGRLSVFH
jgi:hypothetical protein